MKPTLIVVDVETDGPCPGLYSMVSFGAVVVEPKLERTFFGQVCPLKDARYMNEALAVSGITRQEHLTYPDPVGTMADFAAWLQQFERPVFVSDNPAFDWQFINYYFCLFGPKMKNPFGHSARRIGDLYSGMQGDMKVSNKWKEFRKTKHTHHPVDDAKGNAEALLHFAEMGLKGIL